LLEAEMLVGMLASEGIAAHVSGRHLVGAIGELPPGGLLALLVVDEQTERARELILAYNAAAPLSMGLLLEATLGSLVVLCANILLRDIAQRLNRQDVLPASEAEQRYEVQIVCRAEDEIQVRSLMLHSLG
ncbi:putative signal transducing protein, partial [Pseudomonas aeruginosa]